jgi:UDP-2,3-diacylglucosamine pyrophosphatase LpxH
MRFTTPLLLALVVIILGFLPTDDVPRAQAPAPRLIVITSDLHFGPGRDPTTRQWLPVEDFRWSEALASFLNAVGESSPATDLVFNGDTFDLWQAGGSDCGRHDVRVGCTETEALRRLESVLAAHAAEVALIGAFARRGDNRVVFVPGDRDAALLFPSVTERVRAAFGAPGRVHVASQGYWLSDDGLVYAEHGHQLAGDPYRLAEWPLPFVRTGDGQYLERSWGEQLVQALYDELEPRYPIIDNVAQEGAGLKYVVADASAVPPDRIDALLTFFLARPVWQQFRLELDGGDVQPPVWDLDAVRQQGARFLVESLLPDDRLRPRVERAAKEGRLAVDLARLTDQELRAVCDYRAALRRARRRLERSMTQASTTGPPPTECPRTRATRGSAFDDFWSSRDAVFEGRVEQVNAALARDGRATRPVRVLVHGHSHLPAPAFVPVRGASWPIVLNSGAWQRTVTPFQLEIVMQERGWSDAELLQQLQPEDLPACYGVVWIDPYTNDSPSPRLRFWRPDGRWGVLPRDAAPMATACGGGGGPAA